jgi:hypothetical protein
MCINFQISPRKRRFQVGFKKYKDLLMSTFECGLFISSRCQVGFNKKFKNKNIDGSLK